MNFSDFLDPLIIRLKTLEKDSNAVPFFDQMSGAFIWSDEKLRELPTNEMGCLPVLYSGIGQA